MFDFEDTGHDGRVPLSDEQRRALAALAADGIEIPPGGDAICGELQDLGLITPILSRHYELCLDRTITEIEGWELTQAGRVALGTD